ncbi:MAG: adenylate/guanylate cyclase domain-containing protein [Calditrichaeota bacterium]|nr:MAG: adenylate/guanylate cyclase domain-containing protein [Calditrichota bacterium]MBL1206684.1 adenylate/guanylate cyclase domain-containing protein [Calditrichota bacterium]NOG46511.1 adenylate/guanylate cyclase domain-containing protein [Calditrichota bacterium]
MKKHLGRIGYGAFLGFLASVIVWLMANYFANDIMYEYEARTYDWRVKKKVQDVEKFSIDTVVIVDIDGLATSKLGKFSQWPREYYPKLIKNLNDGGAKVIGLDIIFDKVLWQTEQDLQFVSSVREAGNVFNALYYGKADSLNFRYEMSKEPAGFESGKFHYQIKGNPLPDFAKQKRFENEFIELLNASTGNGHVNFNPDDDGVARTIHLFSKFNNHLYPSLALRMFMELEKIDELAMNGPNRLELFSQGNLVRSIPVDENGNMRITYYGTFQTFRYISFYHVLAEEVPKEYYKNKIFLVGTSLAGLFDLRSTPVFPAFPGVEIHANIINTLINDDFIERLSNTQSFLLMVSIGIILGILMSYFTPLYSILLVILTGFFHVIVSMMLFDMNIWVEIVSPMLTIFATFSLVYMYRFATEERKKRFIRTTFSHFVTKSVVDELLANPEKIKLGGEKKKCTVMFSDVAGFTTISEKLSPEALVSLLNDYLTQMTNIVFKYDGMLDKYEGDAIMAVFGAPVSHGNDAFNACATALEMQEALERMRVLWRKQGRDELYARIGVNTGQMVVGNMGSETRFDYTVMGDAVNLGARLEPANKQYGTDIMIGDETVKEAGDKIITRQLDLLRVKGKTEPVKVYELVGITEKGLPDKKMKVIELFKRGFKEYLEQNWDWAINYFEQALAIDAKDGPCQRYVRRCKYNKTEPPGENWDGVFTMKTK